MRLLNAAKETRGVNIQQNQVKVLEEIIGEKK